MDGDFVVMLSGAALSVLFSYIPGFKDWFEKLDGIYKRLVMGGLIIGGAAAVFGLSCAGVLDVVVCDQAGALEAAKAAGVALMANQTAYTITKG